MRDFPPYGSGDAIPPQSDSGDWPTLTEAELAVLPPPYREEVEKSQQEVIIGNMMALEDILKNCRSKLQFAKTFRMLRRDKRRVLQRWRNGLNRAANNIERLFLLANTSMYDRIISHKHAIMAAFFLYTWGERIEDWAGEEGGLMDRYGYIVDRYGCIIVVSFLSTLIAVLLLLLLGR